MSDTVSVFYVVEVMSDCERAKFFDRELAEQHSREVNLSTRVVERLEKWREQHPAHRPAKKDTVTFVAGGAGGAGASCAVVPGGIDWTSPPSKL